MKIMICGSMTFAKEMMNVKNKLEKLGHLVSVPVDTKHHIGNPGLIDDLALNYKHLAEENIMKRGSNNATCYTEWGVGRNKIKL